MSCSLEVHSWSLKVGLFNFKSPPRPPTHLVFLLWRLRGSPGLNPLLPQEGRKEEGDSGGEGRAGSQVAVPTLAGVPSGAQARGRVTSLRNAGSSFPRILQDG